MNDPQQYQDYGNSPSGQNSQYFPQCVFVRNPAQQYFQTPLYMPQLQQPNYCQMFLPPNIPAHLTESSVPEAVPQLTYPLNNPQSLPRRTNPLKILDPETKQRIELPKEKLPVPNPPVSERTTTHTSHPLIVSDPPIKSVDAKIQQVPLTSAFSVAEVKQIATNVEPPALNENPVIETRETTLSAVSSGASKIEKIDLDESEVEEDLDSSSESISSHNSSEAASSSPRFIPVAEEDVDRIMKYDRERLLELRKISETTSPMIEQSSISINQNDRLRNHYRRERQKRCLTLKTDVKLDDVDNAYKPAHLQQADAQKNDRESQISRSLNLVLNRLLDDNISEIVTEINKLSISSPEEMQYFVKILTAKATRQTKYCKVFAKLCVELSKNKTDKFRTYLIPAVNKLFETSLEKHIEEVNANIDAKISETTDEKVKKMLEEDRETAVSKRRESFLGIIQFFSQLFIEKIIPDKSAMESLKAYSKPKTQDEILALLTCLNACGEILERRIPSLLKECINGLETAKKDLKLEQHVLYKITEIIELRNRQWIPLEPINPIPQITPRNSEYRRDNSNRNTQSYAARKFDSQGALNVPSLALSGTKNIQNEKFLGPGKDWTKGSSSNQMSNKNIQHSRFNLLTKMSSGANSESESVKDVSPLGNSPKKQKNPTSIKKDTICDKMETSEAIRESVEAFTLSDTPSYDLMVLDSEKSKYVEEILIKFIEKSSTDRKIVANILSHIYNKNQLTNIHISQGYNAFLATCDEDFMIDYPKADSYISEYMTALVFDTSENLDIVVEILSNLPEARRSFILAQCLHLSSQRIGEEVVSNIFARSSIDWPTFTNSSFRKFAEENGIAFLKNSKISISAVDVLISEQDEKDLIENDKFFISNKTDFDALQKYYTGIANINPQPERSSRHFLSVVLKHYSKQDKKFVDKYMKILAMLADRSEDCDKSLLNTLHSTKIQPESCKLFLRLFLQCGVINKDSFSTFCSNPSIRGNFKNLVKDVLDSQR